MRILIIGLGIGQVYLEQARKRNWETVTVDVNPDAGADFQNLADVTGEFDLAVIAVPNFLHYPLAEMCAKFCRSIIVEKPGFRTFAEFDELRTKYPGTFISIAKNNVYRKRLPVYFENIAAHWDQIKKIEFLWYSKNRIPHPGGWFTDKSKSWGGVSRDLTPHLINEYQMLARELYDSVAIPGRATFNMRQNFTLEQAQNSASDYGSCRIGPDAVYDVDDQAWIELSHLGVEIFIEANWKTDSEDFQGIRVHFKDGTRNEYFLGLCPDECYGIMMDRAIFASENELVRESIQAIDEEMLKSLEKFSKVK